MKLKVDEARKRDVGRQIARIPVSVADKLGLRTGDIVEIKGERTSYAKVWRSSPPEIKDESIKIEALTRRNLKVSLDDFVEISAAKASLAISVVITPIQHISVTDNLVPYMSKALMDRIMVKGDIISMSTGFGGSLYFNVGQTDPEGPVLFNDKTSISISGEPISNKEIEEEIPGVSFESVGGLSDEIQKIREMIELPLRFPEVFDHLGIQPPKGVLLYGPPGTGKTLLARAIANETQSSFYTISGPEITSKYYGESESKLREIFESAKNSAPSIIFFDEIDSLVPKRDEGGGEVERRIVAQLLSLMDGVNTRGDVVILGATNRPNSIDLALRRGGRFDREIEIGIPSTSSRLEILQIHTRTMPLNEDVSLEDLATRTHGFVGSDIQVLTKEAALHSLRRFLPNLHISPDPSEMDPDTLSSLNITMTDFEKSLKEITPSALREVFVEVPDIQWDDIGGLEDVKKKLLEAVEWPIKYKEAFEALGATPPSGILLYGPPGTGKTLLAKAVANSSNANFISIKGPELLSKWKGESEKGMREIFRKARSAAPCIIFFDEIDSIASSRDNAKDNVDNSIVAQMLTEMDGLEETKGVLMLAATNRPRAIDPALMRPGRFDKVILVGNPDQKSREQILKVHLKNTNLDQDVSISDLASKTEGFSGAELSAIVADAKLEVIDQYITKNEETYFDNLHQLIITQSDLDKAIKSRTPSSISPYQDKPAGLSEIPDDGFA